MTLKFLRELEIIKQDGLFKSYGLYADAHNFELICHESKVAFDKL